MNRLVAGLTELLRRSLGERIEIASQPAEDLWPIHADAAGLESRITPMWRFQSIYLEITTTIWNTWFRVSGAWARA